MSQQAFADFYEKHLNSPEGEAMRAKIDGAKDADEFCATVVETGKAAGFDFSDDDVRQVMKASEAQMAKALAEASGELADDQLESVAGGASFSTSIPTVSIKTLPSYLDAGRLEYRTVMCPW